MRRSYILWLLQTGIIAAPRAVSSQEQCTLCLDGSPIPDPDRKLKDGPFEDCAALGNMANSLPVGSAICESVQKLGTLCGCLFPESACTLCYDGSRITNKTKETDVHVSDYLIGVSSDDEKMDCETLEAVMHHEESGSRTCFSNQKNASQQCGCPPPPDDIVFNETSGDNTTTRPPVEMCTICIDGGDITDPDRPIDLGDESPLHDCRGLAESAVLFEVGSSSCTGIRNIGTYCGCSYQRNECSLCPNGEPVPYPYRQVRGFPSFSHIEELGEVDVGSFLTCGVYEAFMQNIDGPTIGASSETLCLSAHARSQSCGCSLGWKQVLLVWCYRVSGILSLIGSVSILLDIVRSRKKKLHNTYHQFLLGVSAFDGLSSIMYILATVMLPEETGYYGAFGNDTACKVQGFVLQWGLTSVFYNAMLSMYFFLVICYNFKEERLRRLLPYCHAVVNLVGIGLAVGGIWFYGEQRSVCYVTVPLVAKSWLPLIFFNTAPLALALLTMTISTVLICHKVYGVDRKSQRWSMHSSRSENYKTSKLVFWQSLWYALSFLLTLPFLTISYYVQFQHDHSYWFTVLAAFLAPAQGFLNALVYYKRKSGLLVCCGCGNTDAKDNTSSSRRGRSSNIQINGANLEGNVGVSELRTDSRGRHIPLRFSRNAPDISDEYTGVRECWELTRGDVSTPFNFRSFLFLSPRALKRPAANDAAAKVTNSTDSVAFRTREAEDQVSIPVAVEDGTP